MEDLFGYEHNGEVKKGILENSDGKMLCIQDAQYLSDQAQEKLQTSFVMDTFVERAMNMFVFNQK